MYCAFRMACEHHATLMPNSFMQGSSTAKLHAQDRLQADIAVSVCLWAWFFVFRLASANGGQQPMLPTGCLASQCAIIT